MRAAIAALLFVVSVAPAGAAENTKTAAARERINKAWDMRIEKIRNKQIDARCRTEAKKKYYAIRFNKRRAFVRDSIERARH